MRKQNLIEKVTPIHKGVGSYLFTNDRLSSFSFVITLFFQKCSKKLFVKDLLSLIEKHRILY